MYILDQWIHLRDTFDYVIFLGFCVFLLEVFLIAISLIYASITDSMIQLAQRIFQICLTLIIGFLLLFISFKYFYVFIWLFAFFIMIMGITHMFIELPYKIKEIRSNKRDKKEREKVFRNALNSQIINDNNLKPYLIKICTLTYEHKDQEMESYQYEKDFSESIFEGGVVGKMDWTETVTDYRIVTVFKRKCKVSRIKYILNTIPNIQTRLAVIEETKKMLSGMTNFSKLNEMINKMKQDKRHITHD